RVAGEQDPRVGVVQRQVVLGVAGRAQGGQGAVGRPADLLAVGQHVYPVGRRGREPAVERVQQVAVDQGSAVDQLGGIDEVPGPLLVDVDGGVGEGGGHIAHTTGVIEVDVRHGHPGQLPALD